MPVWDGSSGGELAEPVLAGSNFPLIDAADGRNRGFNMTVGSTHKMPTLEQVTKVRHQLGLKEGQLLHIVYLVLPEQFCSFNVPWPTGADADVSRKMGGLLRLYKAKVPSPLGGDDGARPWRNALERWAKLTTNQDSPSSQGLTS